MVPGQNAWNELLASFVVHCTSSPTHLGVRERERGGGGERKQQVREE